MARILVVDDNVTNGRTMARLLELEGHSTTFAEGGRQAFAHLQEHPVDILILDLMMPEMSGLEILRIVRARWLPNLPVLIYSAATDPAYRLQANTLGAEGFLTKMSDPWPAVSATIKAILVAPGDGETLPACQ